MRMMYFRGPNPDEGDEYIVFTEDSPDDAPTEDYARPGFRCLYELEFDQDKDGEGDGWALPTEHEMKRSG